MAQAKIDGFVTYHPRHQVFSFHTYDPTQYGPEWVVIRPQTLELEVPDDFDPREQQVAALRRQKDKIAAEFTARVTELQEQINKLLALEAA